MPSPERRTVAVLFCDLSGFTRLSAGRDPEEVRDLIDALFTRFRAAIEGQGGAVDKFIGDAVMAVFGAPVARGDDAARSVRAGLALQREIAAFSAERGIELRLRVGINAGEVLWGSVGGGAPTAMGEAVNVAQRLEGAAEPGTVLVSGAVARAARGAAVYRAAGVLALKGIEGGVEASVAEAPSAGTFSEVSSAPVPFAGRDDELGVFRRAMEGGAGGAWVIEGDAGVGKSRLLGEARRAWRSARPGAFVAVGRALEGIARPLGPFGEMVRGVAGTDDPVRMAAALSGTMAAAGPVAAENRAHLILLSLGLPVPGSRVQGIEPERRAQETDDAWAAWFRAARPPALVCVEDLQWADAGTRRLLEVLAARLAGAPVVIAATTRPGAPQPAGFRVLPLREFDAATTRRLASHVLGDPAGDDLAAWLHAETGGHPYYVEELARQLREGGLVEGLPLSLRERPGRPADGLRGLLVARLDALPEPARETLKAAAPLGRSFWPALVASALGRDVWADLEEAEARGLLSTPAGPALPGEPELAFRHALLRDAALSLLTRRDSQRLHRVYAAQLETRAATAGRRALALAAGQHAQAGDAPAAARAWAAVADEAFSADSLEEACSAAAEAWRAEPTPATAVAFAESHARVGRHAEAAEAARRGLAFEGLLPAQRSALRRCLGDVAFRQGRLEEAAACHSAAAAEGPATARAQALTALCHALHSIGRNEEALAACAEADAVLDAEESRVPGSTTRLKGRVAWARGRTLWNTSRYREAAAAFDRALDFWRAAHDRAGVASALAGLSQRQSMTGEPALAARTAQEAIDEFRAIGDRRPLAAALRTLADAHTHLGDLAAARAALAESRSLSEEVGEFPLLVRALVASAHVELAAGLPAEAEAHARRGVEIARRTGGGMERSEALAALAEVCAFRGAWEESEALERETLEIHRASGHLWNEMISHSLLVSSALAQGQVEEALRRVAAMEARAEAIGFAQLRERARFARACALLKSDPRGCWEIVQSLGVANNPALSAVAVNLVAARAAAALGLHAEAASHLAQVVAVPWLDALDRLRLAEAEAEIALARGDRARAAAVAGEALRQATAAGALGIRPRIEALAARAGALPPPIPDA